MRLIIMLHILSELAADDDALISALAECEVEESLESIRTDVQALIDELETNTSSACYLCSGADGKPVMIGTGQVVPICAGCAVGIGRVYKSA